MLITPPWSDGWLPLAVFSRPTMSEAASFGPPLPMIQSTLWSQPASPVSAVKQQLDFLERSGLKPASAIA
jgi:hypothetical protein